MIVFDLDDLCDDFDPWFELEALKERFPGLKVTLFAIPSRCSPGLLEKYGELEWVELGVHGYHHSSMECATWGSEETLSKLEELEEWWPGVKLFKAPGWIKNKHVDRALEKRGWSLADHIGHIEEWEAPRLRRYVYNGSDGITSIHGHTWDCSGNGPSDWAEMFRDIPDDSLFEFVSEHCTDFGDYDEVQDGDSSWSHSSRWGEYAAIRMEEFLDTVKPSGPICDFGGNDGFAALVAKEKGLDITVLDSNPKRLLYCRHVLGIPTMRLDLTDIDLEDSHFDWGFCSHTLEHIPDIEAAIKEIKRVCKLGCWFVLPIEDKDSFDGNPAHHWMNSSEGWAKLLGTEDLSKRDFEYIGKWTK
jgi:SAM-dependent methyltransferase